MSQTHPTEPQEQDVLTLARGAGVVFSARMLARFLQFLTQVLLARWLGPASFGLYGIGSYILYVANNLGLLGMDKAVIYYGTRALEQGQQPGLLSVLKHGMLLAYAGGGLAGGLVYFLSPWIAIGLYQSPDLVLPLQWFGVAVALLIWLQTAAAATQISKQMQYSVFAGDVLPAFLRLFLVILLAVTWNLSVPGAVFAIVAGYALGWLAALFFLRRLFGGLPSEGGFSLILLGEYFRYSLPIFFSSSISFLALAAIPLLLGALVSSQAVGIFQSAFQVTLMPTFILSAVNAIFMPMISAMHHAGDLRKLGGLFRFSTQWSLYLSLPVFLLLLIAPELVMRVVFGEEYQTGAETLRILAAAQLFNVATGPVGLVLMMTRYQAEWAWACLIALIVSLVTSLVWIPLWGISGGAMASSVGVVVNYAVGLVIVRWKMKLWPYEKQIWKGFLAAGLAGIVVWVVLTVPLPGDWLKLGLASLGAVVAFWGALWLLGLSAEDQVFVDSIRQRIRIKR